MVTRRCAYIMSKNSQLVFRVSVRHVFTETRGLQCIVIRCTWIRIFESHLLSSRPVGGRPLGTIASDCWVPQRTPSLRLYLGQTLCTSCIWIGILQTTRSHQARYLALSAECWSNLFHCCFLVSVLIRLFHSIIHRSTSSSNLCDVLSENVCFRAHLACYVD